jgi:nitric oxide reductase NorQ protein
MTASTLDSYRISEKPYYLSRGGEVAVFESASSARLPVMLKGPTGCGKTRFVEHMAFRLQRPLITVACHEDLFASDLIGRGVTEKEALRTAVCLPLTDDARLLETLYDLIDDVF